MTLVAILKEHPEVLFCIESKKFMEEVIKVNGEKVMITSTSFDGLKKQVNQHNEAVLENKIQLSGILNGDNVTESFDLMSGEIVLTIKGTRRHYLKSTGARATDCMLVPISELPSVGVNLKGIKRGLEVITDIESLVDEGVRSVLQLCLTDNSRHLVINQVNKLLENVTKYLGK